MHCHVYSARHCNFRILLSTVVQTVESRPLDDVEVHFYLSASTEGLGIVYSCSRIHGAKDGFDGYTDSDWVGSPDRSSRSGSVLFYNSRLVH